MPNLIKKIQNTAFQNDLWKRGSKIVLGVSGGADSVCMLDVMAKLAPKYGLKLIVAHVNYGLRGRDSDGDEKFVKELAKGYNLPFFNLSPALSLIKERETRKIHSENELREIRYDFFEKVRRENKFDLIAVAHNSDDQVETFLMRLIRGAGLKGLSAMRYKSGKVIRPFLGTSRDEILEYLKKEKKEYRADKTNLQNRFFRNKVRNMLIPFLEKNFNPNVRKTIFDATISVSEDLSLIQELVPRALGSGKALSAKEILKLHPALQRRILLSFISGKKSNIKDVEAGHIEEMLKAIRSTKRKNQVVVFKGLKMEKKGDKVTISKLNN